MLQKLCCLAFSRGALLRSSWWQILLALLATAHAAEAITPPPDSSQVQLFFDVPDGISPYTTAYHPVTFGVPFPAGTLKTSDQLRIVNSSGQIQPAAFDRKTRWDDTYVKWVHIDLLVAVTKGQIRPLYLQFGPTVPAPPAQSQPLTVTALPGGRYTVNTQAGTFTVTPTSSSIGRFELHKVLNGVTTSYSTFSPQTQVQYETGDLETNEIPDAPNKIRATIKVTGQYRADSGQTPGPRLCASITP
jgi:PcRGLX-like N-terminal RIFT barrel domain